MVMWWKILILLFILLFAVFSVWLMLGEKVPADELTRSQMYVIFYRVVKYVEKNGDLPKNILDLPKREGANNRINDGWGRRIMYSIENNKVILKSFGKDGKPGGTGESADIIGQFDPYVGFNQLIRFNKAGSED